MKSNSTGIQHTCPWWLIFTFDNPLRQRIHDPQQILGAYVNPGDIALDAGCGMGYFTLTLAWLVGGDGRVIAADLQEKMLSGLQRRAERAGLLGRIQLQRSAPDRIGVAGPIDFALAFWMVHEVRQPEPFLREIHAVLKHGGRLLIVEPKLHVPAKSFERTVGLAQSLGFTVVDRPHVRVSRAVLFHKLDH
jgi:ubiquinone/menaquinone biosynthesis C-methylase UbiE